MKAMAGSTGQVWQLSLQAPWFRSAVMFDSQQEPVDRVERSDRSDRSGQRIAWPITSKLTHPDRA